MVKEYNDVMLGIRVLGSGAFPGMKGDVDLVTMLGECKTRGTVNSSGEKTISILKSMLEKIKKEAGHDKLPILPFQYKGDETVYVAMEFDILLWLVHQIEELKKGE